jgi:hypothetical protein
MGPFFWLLRMTAQALWPFYVVAGALVVWAAVQRLAVPCAEPGPPVRMLGAALAAPLALTVWSSATFGVESGGGRPWASAVLSVLAVGILIFTVWVLRRWRTRMLIALPVAVAAAVATFIAWFIGAMAIVDDWI